MLKRLSVLTAVFFLLAAFLNVPAYAGGITIDPQTAIDDAVQNSGWYDDTNIEDQDLYVFQTISS